MQPEPKVYSQSELDRVVAEKVAEAYRRCAERMEENSQNAKRLCVDDPTWEWAERLSRQIQRTFLEWAIEAAKPAQEKP